ncbi:MAG: glycosyltransferase family 4 protein, partial [Lachnospiraceae bacterium]|nr:glycosyltransferase family 4 protein [Lachnospiraceae bacterium]
IVHSRSDGEELLKLKKEAKFMRNPHPTYGSFQVRNLTKSQARAELGRKEEEKILLFFGFVREYKGLKTLLRAMPKIKACGGDIILIVAGSFDGDREEYVALLREMHIEEIVHIVDGYLPDNEVEKYFAACDLVVAPYESATQSGIVQIAFGFEKPVVATNVGGLPDVVEDGRTGYVVEPGDPEALAEAVVKFFREKKGSAFRENVRQEAGRFSWERMRETIEELGGF